jgi:hypothetical protein
MRTLSGKFAFVVLAVIVIVGVVSCCNFPFIPKIASYSVEIGGKQKGLTYVEWKDEDQFKQALKQVRGHGGEYCICVLEKPRAKPYLYNDSKCHKYYKCPSENSPSVNIGTVKVTKSKAADNIAAGESAVNDPNVTYRVQSAYPGDIKTVVDALKKTPATQ